MRLLLIALGAIAACGGGGATIHNLPLTWRSVEAPIPSPAVAEAFAAIPMTFGLRDLRADPSAVGVYERTGFVVRTIDNVGQYCSNRVGELLTQAGARLNEVPKVVVEAELLDYRVVEGGTYSGMVRLRAIVHRGGGQAWSKIYQGRSRRWGRTHNPDNFNEALSNALTDVAKQLVRDDGFARALMGEVVDPALPPPPRALVPRPAQVRYSASVAIAPSGG